MTFFGQAYKISTADVKVLKIINLKSLTIEFTPRIYYLFSSRMYALWCKSNKFLINKCITELIQSELTFKSVNFFY